MQVRIWEAYGDEGVRVWGIANREAAETVRGYTEALGLTYPILLDEDGVVQMSYMMQAAFDTAAYPQDWVIGTDGRVAYVNNGYEPDEIAAVVEQELAGY